MLSAGVGLLIVAIAMWGLYRLAPRGAVAETVVVLGQVIGAIGVIAIVIGLILHFAPLGGVVDEHTLKGLIE